LRARALREYVAPAIDARRNCQRETRSAASPGEYEQFFKKHGLLASDVQHWIDDYEHFLKHNEVRRRDKFED
jgi:hypothetical protein